MSSALRVLLALLLVAAPLIAAQSDGSMDEEEELLPGFDNEEEEEEDEEDFASESQHKHTLDAAEEGYDEDEFEGIPTDAVPESLNQQVPRRPPPADTEPKFYVLEICAIVFLALYTLFFFLGKDTNEELASAWYSALEPLFGTQFYELGAFFEEDEARRRLVQESMSSYKFWASGRRFCAGALATLTLKGRHDLFSRILAMIDLSAKRDTVTLDVSMNPENMDPFVFALVETRRQKRMRKAETDLGQLATAHPCPRIDYLTVLTDASEVIPLLVDAHAAEILRQHKDLFVSLHCTDRYEKNKQLGTHVLSFTFVLPAFEHMDRLIPLFEFAFRLVDRVAETQLSKEGKARSLKKRSGVKAEARRATHEQRQEAIQKRKEEERRQRKEADLLLSAEAQRKKEVREHRRNIKKRQKQKIRVMH